MGPASPWRPFNLNAGLLARSRGSLPSFRAVLMRPDASRQRAAFNSRADRRPLISDTADILARRSLLQSTRELRQSSESRLSGHLSTPFHSAPSVREMCIPRAVVGRWALECVIKARCCVTSTRWRGMKGLRALCRRATVVNARLICEAARGPLPPPPVARLFV